LLFPEVRIKGYLELRSIDAPPVEWQMIPVLFYAGLLYNAPHLEKTLELLSPLAPDINSFFSLAVKGLESDEVNSYSKELMQLAIEGLSCLPNDLIHKDYIQQLIDFYTKFTLQRRSFADEIFLK
jgi:glutamate--cysteine ligase